LERLTVSLSEDTVKKIKRLSETSGLKVSQIVSRALEQELSDQSPVEAPIHPTVLWKLKGRKSLRAPSPRIRPTRVGSWRVVDLDELRL
jgi:hypothetical protein